MYVIMFNLVLKVKCISFKVACWTRVCFPIPLFPLKQQLVLHRIPGFQCQTSVALMGFSPDTKAETCTRPILKACFWPSIIQLDPQPTLAKTSCLQTNPTCFRQTCNLTQTLFKLNAADTCGTLPPCSFLESPLD